MGQLGARQPRACAGADHRNGNGSWDMPHVQMEVFNGKIVVFMGNGCFNWKIDVFNGKIDV